MIPYRCSACGNRSLHHVENLSKRTLDNVTTVEGFECPHCEVWEPVYFMTTSLQENISRLEKLPAHTKKYRMLVAKSLRKADNLAKRYKGVANVQSKHGNLASS